MTAVPPSPASHTAPPFAEPGGRVLAFIGYGLLLVSLFTAGLTALLAAILAYDRKGQSGPLLRSHYAFQLRIFWICFALILAGGALWISALFTALLNAPPVRIHTEPDAVLISLAYGRPIPIDTGVWTYHWGYAPALMGKAWLEAVAGSLLALAGVLFSWIGPLYGLVRLASGRPIGDRRAQAEPSPLSQA
jgi:uncharacterized membrane protein